MITGIALRRTLAASAVAAVASGLLIAGPASAYPPGTNPRVSTDNSNYQPQTKIKINARNVKPGCVVRFFILGTNKEKTQRATDSARASVTMKAPKQNGKYRVRIETRCTGEVASTTIRVK